MEPDMLMMAVVRGHILSFLAGVGVLGKQVETSDG